MTDDEIIQDLTSIVESLSERDPMQDDPQSLDERFANWDSLHQIRVLMAIESGFGISFSPSEIVRPRSMNHLLEMVRGKLGGNAT